VKILMVLALALGMFACGGDDDDDDVISADADPSSIEFSRIVADWQTLQPLEGLKLCNADTQECGTAASTGRVTVRVPKNATVRISYELAGYLPKAQTVMTDESDIDGAWFMQTNDWFDAQFALLSLTPDDSAGHVFVQALEEQEGVSFEITPAAGSGPYYTADKDIGPALTATTLDGLGTAGFVNVPPGTYSITASHATATCVPGDRSPLGTVPSSAEAVVVAGVATTVFFVCQ